MTPSEPFVGDVHNDCGQRLRQAREAAGLSVADVAQRLKMPMRVIESLEAGEGGRREAPVFVRGQLRSYARLLGVRIDADPVAGMASRGPIEPPRLEPRTYTPPMRRMADRLMGRMVYIVITALIAVPVWMATRTHLDSRQVDASASLDLPATNASASRPAGAAPQDTQPRPLVASMTSLPPRAAEQAPALSIRFEGDSWVEIVAPDGNVLERGLLKAGQRRDYAKGQVARVKLGNAGAVQVLGNGSVQDLSAFQRANVARFTVSSDGSIEPLRE